MNQFEEKRNQKIFEILMTLKVLYILLCAVAMMSSIKITKTVNASILTICTVLVAFFIAIYFLWLYHYQKENVEKKHKIINIVEMALLLIIFLIVLKVTGLNDSAYKFICIFIILIGAIQFGRSYSIAIAICSGVIILFIDFFMVLDKEDLSRYFEKDLVLIGALLVTSYILGMYVNIEREHGKELKTLVNIDELTGLYNHRYFQEYLSKSIDYSNKNGNEVSLLFMDIDFFKNYNDINGHQAGDWLLKEIGTILKDCIGENNVVARYGGEEFAAVLPFTKEEEAVKIGEKIRLAVENTYFYGQENQPNKNITISIGVSSYPNRAKTKHQLINTADDALYRAKSFNKNRVESYHNVLEDICKHMDIEEETIKSLKAFISMINIKDRYTYGHTERVVIYTKWFSEHVKLDEDEKIQLRIAAYLHDIGKLEIPEDILNKKDKLTDEEFEILKGHPQSGVDLIRHIEQFKTFIPIIKHHHERYDGRGYPDGIASEEIPYLARMLSIADSFDAMTSNRPYNTRKSHDQAIRELRNNAGTQFDPYLVEEFIKMLQIYKDNF